MKRRKERGILLLGVFAITLILPVGMKTNTTYAQESVSLNETQGSFISQANLDLAKDLAQRISQRPDKVDVTDLFDACGATWSNKEPFIKNVINYLEYVDADFYAFRGTCSFRGIYQRNGSMKIFMTKMHWEETVEEHNEVVKEVERVVSMIPSSLTTAEKIFWVNNYLATTAQYNSDAITGAKNYPHAYTPYGVLLDKTGVCESYAKAFAMIMKRLDIKSYRVTSKDMNHTWNTVMVNGRWYNIDVTHNDPIGQKEDELTYNYFLKSSAYLNAQPRHQAPDEKIVNLNNIDRDENPFGIYTVKKPVFENNKFYLFKNHYNFAERWNMDKTVDLKVYNPNNNTLEIVKDRIEKPVIKIGDKTVVIRMNVENKRAEAFYISDLKNPIGNVELKDLESLKIINDSHGKSAPMNSVRVDKIQFDGSNLKLSLMYYNNSWNNPLLNQPESVIMPISINKSTVTDKEIEKAAPVKPTIINKESEKVVPVKPTVTDEESKKPVPVEPTVVKPTPEKVVPVKPVVTNPTNKKPLPIKPSQAEKDKYEDINKVDNLSELVYLYNKSHNRDERNAIINRMEQLYNKHYNNFKTTYNYNEKNKAIRIAKTIGKRTDIYSLDRAYKEYLNSKKTYETNKFWYGVRLLSYNTFKDSYNQMKKNYDRLTEEYKKSNQLPNMNSSKKSYRSYYRNI